MCKGSIWVLHMSHLENPSFGQDQIDSGRQPVLRLAEGPLKLEAVIESHRPREILIFDISGAEWETLNHRSPGPQYLPGYKASYFSLAPQECRRPKHHNG